MFRWLAIRHCSILVTTPIFYVNGPPHIGHAYSAVLADAITRWLRMQGHSCRLSTGTDEHGKKVMDAALSASGASGPSPPLVDAISTTRFFCDAISLRFRSMCDAMDVQYDDFVRTSEPWHMQTAQGLWRAVRDRGWFRDGSYNGWYCLSDEEFLAEEETICRASDGVRLSARTGNTVQWVAETNTMFPLGSFRGVVAEWLQQRSSLSFPRVVPENRLHEAASLVQHAPDALLLSVSRPAARIPWSCPVDGDPSQNMYVWFDALSSYVTGAAGRWRATSGESNPLSVVHVIGKDILKFHTFYWPAFLHAASMPLPDLVVSHAHWTVDRTKMSKSKGNVVGHLDVSSRYGDYAGLQALRYFLLRDGSLADDADFSWEMLESRANSELSDTVGNLVSRLMSPALFGASELSGTLHGLGAAELQFISSAQTSFGRVQFLFDQFQFSAGLSELLSTVRSANAFFQAQAPWKVVRRIAAAESPSEEAAARSLLFNTMWLVREVVRLSLGFLLPILPAAARQGLMAVGADASAFQRQAGNPNRWQIGPEGRLLRPANVCPPIFPRLATAATTAASSATAASGPPRRDV